MQRNMRLYILIALLGACAVGAGFYATRSQSVASVSHSSQMREYVAHDHKEFVKKQFRDEWEWLISSPDYSIDDMLETKSPNNYEPNYRGKLLTRVYYEGGAPVGFAAYYMLNPLAGDILFIVVDKEHRGHHYAEKMVHCACDELKSLGAKIVKLATRIDNKPARHIYEKIGFKLTNTSPTHAYYRKTV